MAEYTGREWKDHLEDTAGQVIQEGTPLSAKNLNEMEQGIKQANVTAGAAQKAVQETGVEVTNIKKSVATVTTQLADTATLVKVSSKNRIHVQKLENVGISSTVYKVLEMSSEGVLYATDTATLRKLYKSIDNGNKWTLVHEFNSNQIANIKQLTNGELVVGVNGNRNTGSLSKLYLTSNNQSTWTMKFELSNIVCEFATGWGINVQDKNILVSEYGTLTDFALGSPHKVYLSRDNGNTFKEILDISNYSARPNGSHVHGAFYDKYWDRIWVCWGDGGYFNPSETRMGLLYSDDYGISWKAVDIPRQLLTGFAFEDRVIFTSDAIPNGIWSFVRGKKEESPTLEFVHLFDSEQRIHYLHSGQFYKRDENSPLLIPISYANGDPLVTGTKYILATYNGMTFQEIWRDTKNHTSTMSFEAFAPTNDGKLIGNMLGDGRNPISTLKGDFNEIIGLSSVSVEQKITVDNSLHVDARSLGIKGWGFDESPELANAITYCSKNKKVLYIPKDLTISVKDAVVIGLANVEIICDGRITEIGATASDSVNMLKFINCSNIKIHSINFLGNPINATVDKRIDQVALSFEGCRNIQVGELSLENINGRGLKFVSVDRANFKSVRCVGSDTASEFAYIEKVKNLTIEYIYSDGFMKNMDYFFFNIRSLGADDIVENIKVLRGFIRDKGGYTVFCKKYVAGSGYIKDISINLEIARPSSFDGHGAIFAEDVKNIKLSGKLYGEQSTPSEYRGYGIELLNVDGFNIDVEVSRFKQNYYIGLAKPVKNGVIAGRITDSYNSGMTVFQLENVDFNRIIFKNNGLDGTSPNISAYGTGTNLKKVKFYENVYGKVLGTNNIQLISGLTMENVLFENCDFTDGWGNMGTRLRTDTAGVTRLNNKGLNVGYLTAPPTYSYWSIGEKVYNASPTAGGYEGWICTVAGVPGTWKGFGLIQA